MKLWLINPSEFVITILKKSPASHSFPGKGFRWPVLDLQGHTCWSCRPTNDSTWHARLLEGKEVLSTSVTLTSPWIKTKDPLDHSHYKSCSLFSLIFHLSSAPNTLLAAPTSLLLREPQLAVCSNRLVCFLLGLSQLIGKPSKV